MSNPKKETAIITGASSGIGAATAIKLSSEGYDLLLLGRNLENLNKTKDLCQGSGKIEILNFDLKDVLKNKDLILSALTKLSPASLLVNNAGIYKPSKFIESDISVWTEQFQVNLFSAVQLTQIIWPLFVQNHKGSIVNISSTLGVKPTSFAGAYSASKAAMNNWTISLAQEGGAHNIRVNCICPGIVDTPIHSFHTQPKESADATKSKMAEFQLLSFIGQPNDIAEAVYFLGSDLSRWTTGSILHVDGGINIK
jgi:NAD(P)-dependent dehydrogenase (short-subunit alcohol dehydrogenase family)